MGLFDVLRRRIRSAGPQTHPPHQASSTGPVVHRSPTRSGGFAVIDVETTGLSPGRDRVVEIAVITTDAGGQVLDEWATLVNPCQPVGATAIHGITAADVRRAPRFDDMIGELNARLTGQALVAHNARFDLAFLQAEYARAGWQLPAAPHLCTFEASRTYLPALDRRRLIDCCWASGIQLDNAHSALGDARATATLLASYLDPASGRVPEPEHLRLPDHAAQVRWPSIPRVRVDVARRGPDRRSPDYAQN